MKNRRYCDARKKLPKHPTRKWKKRSSVARIIVHTTAGDQQNPAIVANNHIRPGPQNHLSKKGAPAIAYHDFIDKEGVVYHCNSYDDWTWHCGALNKGSIGVVMAFRGQDSAPYLRQYESLIKHLVKLCLYIKLLPKNILGHRELPYMFKILGNGSKRYRKSCPGMQVDMDRVRLLVTFSLQERLKEEGLYKGPIDGLFGAKSKAALNLFKATLCV